MFFFKILYRYFSGISFIIFLNTVTLVVISASSYLVSSSLSCSRFSWASLIALVLFLTNSDCLSLEVRVDSMILFCSLLFSAEMLATFPQHGPNDTDFFVPNASGSAFLSYAFPNLLPYTDA